MANPFVHAELVTTDVVKAKAFSGKLFNWELKDVPMEFGDYTMINVGEGVGGGMMKHLMPGHPSVWMPYVSVDDVKAETAKAASLGGTVVKDVTVIPDMGSFSVILDPTGAVFGLWQSKM